MKKKYFLLIFTLLFISVFVLGFYEVVNAQETEYEINKSVISAAGLNVSSNGYRLNGTFGQSVVGMTSTINYGHTSGFWTFLEEVITKFLIFLPTILR